MAVDAGRYVGARRRHVDRANKERRQKQVLAAGTALLAVVLGIQLVPRLLDRGQAPAPVAGGPVAVPAPVPVTPSDTGAPTRTASPPDAAVVRGLSPKDPFVKQQAGGQSASGAPVPAADGPGVRRSHFVAKDPFLEQSGVSATGTAPALARGPRVRSQFVAKDPFTIRAAGDVSAPAKKQAVAAPDRRTSGKYVVVLASIPVPNGYAAAASLAGAARARGVERAGVLRSSRYRTLRRGFYVVYGGIYPTANAALRALAAARAHGFPAAYTRPLRG